MPSDLCEDVWLPKWDGFSVDHLTQPTPQVPDLNFAPTVVGRYPDSPRWQATRGREYKRPDATQTSDRREVRDE